MKHDPIYSLLRFTKLNSSLTKEARSGTLDRRGEELHFIVWSIKAHPKGGTPLHTLKKQCKEFFFICIFFFYLFLTVTLQLRNVHRPTSEFLYS